MVRTTFFAQLCAFIGSAFAWVDYFSSMQQQCFFCGYQVKLVHVHGHYQCPVCGTNAMPCCDGDNCDTNLILRISSDTSSSIQQTKEMLEQTGHPKNG